MDSHFYVFGAGHAAGQLSYIGLCDCRPDEHKEEILRGLARSGSASLAVWIAEMRRRSESDLFVIEDCPTRREAEDAVSFWRSYYRWLGFELLSGGDAINAVKAYDATTQIG